VVRQTTSEDFHLTDSVRSQAHHAAHFLGCFSPDVVSYNMKDGNKYLPRLPREYYQGDAFKQSNKVSLFIGLLNRQFMLHELL